MHANRFTVTICAAALLLAGWARDAAAQVKGIPAADSAAQLNQRIDALTARVKQLELAQANFVKSLSKPDVPDDAGDSTKKALAQSQSSNSGSNAPSGGGNAPSGGGNAPSNGSSTAEAPPPKGENLLDIARRLTALENRHRMTAPFEVADATGKLIFRVEDAGSGGGRGAYVFDNQAHLVVSAYSGTEGGTVDVVSGNNTEMRARLSGAGPSISILKGAEPLITLETQQGFGQLEIVAQSRTQAILGGTAGGGRLLVNGSMGQGALSATDEGTSLHLGLVGAPVVRIESDPTGGLVRVGKRGSVETTYATMAATKDGLGFKVRSSGTALAYVGLGEDGTSGLVNVFGPGGKPAAALQTYGGGKGQISVFNSAGIPIVFLAESDKHPGGGNVTATDSTGNGIFSAGYAGGDGGEVCVDRKGASSLLLKCLGVALP